MKITFTRNQRRYVIRWAHHQKVDDQTQAVINKCLPEHRLHSVTVDLRKLSQLELLLLIDAIDEVVMRFLSHRRKLRVTRFSLGKKLKRMKEFEQKSAVDRLAELAKGRTLS